MVRLSVLGLLLLVCIPIAMGYTEKHNGGHDRPKSPSETAESGSADIFLLRKWKRVVRSEAGEVKVAKGYRGRHLSENPMHIGFISMEPNSLFIPQYMDSSFIILVRTGEAKIGWIHREGLVERELKSGDLYRIPAGSAFYIVNTHNSNELQIVCSIDTRDNSGLAPFQSFFIAGGRNPMSVLTGFDRKTLKSAFNVSTIQLEEMLRGQHKGPIVHITHPDQPSKWASFMQLKHQQRLVTSQEKQQQTKWSWRKLLISIFGKEEKNNQIDESTEECNIYNKKPDFQNNYGWSTEIDETDYNSLEHSGISAYLVNLTAGSMMAPHVNPSATEYGVILRGSGSIQVVYPDGRPAMNAQVHEGDVFWIPRCYPFCQIASADESMEFFGFTTSAHKNRPQFLAGASSVLHSMNGPELATAFDIGQDNLNDIMNAQRESIILPALNVNPPKAKAKAKQKLKSKHNHHFSEPADHFVNDFSSNLFMGFP